MSPERATVGWALVGITVVVVLAWYLGYLDVTPGASDLEHIGREIPQP